jgi:glycosyltransferase involved in cell wall biosynthesis
MKNLQRALEIQQQYGWRTLRNKVLRRLFGAPFGAGAWELYSQEAQVSARMFDFSTRDVETSQQVQSATPGPLPIQHLTWFLPEFKHATYGGIYTILRLADFLTRHQAISHQFKILGGSDPEQVAQQVARQIASSFPALAGQSVESFQHPRQVARFSASDAAVATLWGTAYALLHYNQTRRKFYFLQDYEALFYPAGTISAQAEATYRFGFYGIANTPPLAELYTQYSGGSAIAFTPCVDPHIFYPAAQPAQAEPYTLFFYARPGHPRNGFELGAQALRLLKQRLGKRLRILCAGDNWQPRRHDLHGVVENLGVLEYAATAQLYRTCQAGLVMMFTRHPSYIPLELMACGSLVVSNFNPATGWLLKHRQNCLLSGASATCLADTLEQGLLDHSLRQQITTQALSQVHALFQHWDVEMERIYQFMTGDIGAQK